MIKVGLMILIAYFAWISTVVNYSITNRSFPLTQGVAISPEILGWQRETVEKIVREGALSSLGVNARFDFVPQYSWTSQEYLSFLTRKPINIVDSPPWWTNTNIQPDLNCIPLDSCSNTYYVSSHADSYSSGFLAISKFENLELQTNSVYSKKWILFINDKGSIDRRKSVCLLGKDSKSKAAISNTGILRVDDTYENHIRRVKIISRIAISDEDFDIC